jgi:putative FmdB family regulatory protein
MPIYEFTCQACGARFEELVRRDATAPCPECGSAEVERLLSQVFPAPKIGLRGLAAKRSDTSRANREEQRKEGFAKDREARKKG